MAQQELDFKRARFFLVQHDQKHVALAMGISARGHFEKSKDRFRIIPDRNEIPVSDIVSEYQGYFLSKNIPERIHEKTKYRVRVLNDAGVPIKVGKGRMINVLAVDNFSSISRSPFRKPMA